MSRALDAFIGGLHRLFAGVPPATAATSASPLPAEPPIPARMGQYEALALRLLRQERIIGIEALIERVAEEAYSDDLRAGGAAVDLGAWGPALYRREATAGVCRLVGHTLVLEDDGGPLAVQAAWA